MSTLRPILAKKSTQERAADWSRAVFARWGRVCVIHLRRDPKSKMPATDPAHVIDRARMGAALAYGPKDGPVEPRLGRPLCRACHDRQGRKDAEIDDRFDFATVVDAVLCHNAYARCLLPMPDPAYYPAWPILVDAFGGVE